MCDIWKGNSNRKQLKEADVKGLLESLHQFGTQQVLFSGGEALLHPLFFRFCEMIRQQGIRISLLSTGLTLKQHAHQLIEYVNDIVVSLDGDAATHDRIRNIPHAYDKLAAGIQAIKDISPSFRITARSVIHQLNFRVMPEMITTAKRLGVDQLSFFPADVSSSAFNREIPWNQERKEEILVAEDELPLLKQKIEHIIIHHQKELKERFIAESALRLLQIHQYYAAFYGKAFFPYKKCNAPWVSTVIEADGTIRPCFFHEPMGNIRTGSLEAALNSDKATAFRKGLNISRNDTCKKCVCSLYLAPGAKIN